MSLLTNLVSYYKFDQSSGSTIADQVGSNTLTTQNSPGFITGKINNALQLIAASSQYATKASPTNIPASNTARTISFWIKLNTNNAKQMFVEYGTFGNQDQIFGIDINTTGNPEIACWADDYTSAQVLSTGSWYHLVGIYDGNLTTKLYINGSFDGSHTLAGQLNTVIDTNGLQVGAWNTGGSFANFVDGLFDELGIWSRALNASEISQLYNSGNGLQYPFNSTGRTLATPRSLASSRSLSNRSLTSSRSLVLP